MLIPSLSDKVNRFMSVPIVWLELIRPTKCKSQPQRCLKKDDRLRQQLLRRSNNKQQQSHIPVKVRATTEKIHQPAPPRLLLNRSGTETDGYTINSRDVHTYRVTHFQGEDPQT
jgi:hypothetical protein